MFLALIAIILQERLIWLFSKDYPNATDSFFYLQELKSRINSGEGYYLKHSLFFTFWSLVGWLCGLKPFQVHDLIFLCSISFICIAILIYLKGKAPLWISFSLIFLFLASDLLFYRHYAFLKQGFAISLIFTGVALFFNGLEGIYSRYFSFILVLIGSVLHFYAAVIGGIFLFCMLLAIRCNKKAVLLISTSILLNIALFYFGSLREIFQLIPLRKSGWWGTCSDIQCSAYEWNEFFAYYVFYIISAFILFISGELKRAYVFQVVLVLLIFFNLAIWTPIGDMRDRLAVSTLWLIFFGLTDALKSNSALLKCSIFILCAFIFYCFNISYRKPYNANRLPYFELERKSAALKQWIPSDSFILAEHGYEFPLTYFLDRKAASSLPDETKVSTYFQLRPILPNSEMMNTCITDINLTNLDSRCFTLDSNWILLRLSK